MKKRPLNHYDWLKEHFVEFLTNIGFADARYCGGMIVAHGDKCSQYRERWNAVGIPFEHGVAIYLLTYLSPYSKESRETANGWVDPYKWVIDAYPRFVSFLPPKQGV
jgi:hypothetical protein